VSYKYHNPGIPTKEIKEGETYLPGSKMYVSGYNTSSYKIEWMRFEKVSPLPELVKTIPHIAFEVDDLNETIKEKEILIHPNSPSDGITAAFIIDNGAPVELLQIDKQERN